MSHIAGSWSAMKSTIRNFFRPIKTESVRTFEAREPRYRGSFALVHDEHGEEACIGCKMCMKVCPSQVINVVATGRKESPVTGKKRGYCEDFTLDLQACIYCEYCIQVCPEDSIIMVKEQEKPTFSREDLLLTMEKLYANENDPEKPLYWASGSILVEMQNPKRGLPEEPKPAPKAKAAPKGDA